MRARRNSDCWRTNKKPNHGDTETQRKPLEFFLWLFSVPLRLRGENTLTFLHDTTGGTSLTIKLHPRAKNNAITGEVGDTLKVSLTAPPVDGKANQACIGFFAELLKVPRSSITIASGQTSRHKVIRVAGLSAEEIRKRLSL